MHTRARTHIYLHPGKRGGRHTVVLVTAATPQIDVAGFVASEALAASSREKGPAYVCIFMCVLRALLHLRHWRQGRGRKALLVYACLCVCVCSLFVSFVNNMCTYMYIYIYIYIYMYIFIYTLIHACIHTWFDRYWYIHTYTSECICTKWYSHMSF